ncbi:MAG TPA: hypothetical protein VMZ00_09955 [Sporichthya sp.]|nr:hypothetical protein [Sporichthya sp.]
MADRAEVVPLPLGRRARSAPEFPEPTEYFSDAANPARALSVTWSPDHRAVQVSIDDAGGPPTALLLDADDVLDLVRALVTGLPEPGPACPRPPATVLPLTPRR